MFAFQRKKQKKAHQESNMKEKTVLSPPIILQNITQTSNCEQGEVPKLSTSLSVHYEEKKKHGVQEICIECEDQLAVLFCEQCEDIFCHICYQTQHRKGNRILHTTQRIHDGTPPLPLLSNIHNGNPDWNNQDKGATLGDWWEKRPHPLYFVERSKYIPIRLQLKKRKFMRLLKAALKVINYVDTVETSALSGKRKAKQSMKQLKTLSSLLYGLLSATDIKYGREIMGGGEFKKYADFFRGVIEIGRRHKIRNPEKMRSIYGTLIYLLQDSVRPSFTEELEFELIRSIRTVHTFLQRYGGLHILKDEYVPLATGEIIADGKSRAEIDRAIRMKEKAITYIARKYKTDILPEDKIRMCLLSIGDNHSYLRFNRDPCLIMIKLLKTNFSPDNFYPRYCLAIKADNDGSRLTHDHAAQYHYALQTLTLWSIILHDMYRLWHLAEEDLLDPRNPYIVKNTGQGLQRVQQCPRTTKAMRKILYDTQQKVGFWVGSSVIHLGDDNVPNSLMFIDKYNQVARILLPIVTCLQQLPVLYRTEQVKMYVDSTFGSLKDLRFMIMTDFFRSAFDGSGADNFFSAGSCIDGRLTSAWNWCSQLEKKSFYPVFLLTGFVGFDGKYWGE